MLYTILYGKYVLRSKTSLLFYDVSIFDKDVLFTVDVLIVAARAARRFSSFVLPTSGVACCWVVCIAEVGDAGTLRIIVLLVHSPCPL
jgi:hypothetical protein